MVLDYLDPRWLHSPQEIFRRAVWCNFWAKRVNAETRIALYRTKNRCIRLLQVRFSAALDVRGDLDRHRGLLSIGLRDEPRHRLHSHENWMPVGSEHRGLSRETPKPSRAAQKRKTG